MNGIPETATAQPQPGHPPRLPAARCTNTPDHSTISRRAETLEVAGPRRGRAPVHLLVGGTGLRLCGPGEWLVEKHGTRRRRAWKKLHLATDADTGHIVASVLTDKILCRRPSAD